MRPTGKETNDVFEVVNASAGVGITLALQESLSDLAGGVFILLLKPFKVGDYIIESTNKMEGTVQEIKLFFTILWTMDSRLVVIPNSQLMSNSLTNVSANEERQLDLKIQISYNSDLRKAKQVVERILSHRYLTEAGNLFWRGNQGICGGDETNYACIRRIILVSDDSR